MGHGKAWGGIKPDGIKTQNLGNGIGEPNAGQCKCCGEWETDLSKEGYCRDEKCKRGRQLLKLAAGQAVFGDDKGMWSLDRATGTVRKVG